MIIQFKDKSHTIKHLGFILEVKQINSQTLKIKETMQKNSIMEDLLFYKTESILKKDLKNIFKKLDEYSRFVNDMQQQQEMGFNGNGSGDEIDISDIIEMEEAPEE